LAARPGLRVGLTGGLGAGKSTVAAMLQARGAHVLSADELSRKLMEPGTEVFAAIQEHFGPGVVQPDGRLNRPELARLAFVEGRVEELNAIVHPATIARQQQLAAAILAKHPEAIVVVESALLFETRYNADGPVAAESQPWRERFDRLLLVTAPESLKVARFVQRSGRAQAQDCAKLEDEARRRLAHMISDELKAPRCDFVVHNDGSLAQLEEQVDQVWRSLQAINLREIV
jgi:dephospho-CoA kinase